MNKGLSNSLKAAFTDIVPVVRSIIENGCQIVKPEWLAGFTAGEGCFRVNTSKYERNKFGVRVVMIFRIIQHVRDEFLLNNIKAYLGCGSVSKHSKEVVVFEVSSLKDINEKIIPFFNGMLRTCIRSKTSKL